MSETDRTIESVNDLSDFDRIALSMSKRLERLGDYDPEQMSSDLRELSAPLSDSTDPDVLTEDLKRVQAFKDRAVELVKIANKAYLTHKRVVEILTKGWTSFSQQKSAEKREGEGLLKFSNFIMAANDAECAYRHALGVMRNLESQQENLEEQVRCALVSSRLGQRPGWGGDNITDWDKFNEKDAADGDPGKTEEQ